LKPQKQASSETITGRHKNFKSVFITVITFLLISSCTEETIYNNTYQENYSMGDQVILTENVLNSDYISSVSEQEGPYATKPVADVSNTGDLTVQTTGTAADEAYSSTTDSAGAGDGTTTICSDFDIFGDDFFIGATMRITSGSANGEEKTVTDFAQSTGTFTHAAFSVQIGSGITFTVTIPISTREFKLEVTGSGDLGDATYKATHNDGTTYLGRDPLNYANWIGDQEVHDDNHATYASPAITTTLSGDIVVMYIDDSESATYCATYNKSDFSWSKVDTGIGDSYAIKFVITLNTGRLYCGLYGNRVIYSDDDGATWAERTGLFDSAYYIGDGMQLADGRIAIVAEHASNNEVYLFLASASDGFNFGDPITVAADTNDQDQPTIAQAANGDILVAYRTDEDSASSFEVKLKKSTNGGVTFGSAIDVVDYSATNYSEPRLFVDVDGNVYCAATKLSTDNIIELTLSTDNGDSFTSGSPLTLKSEGSADIRYPNLTLWKGMEVLCAYADTTNNTVDVCRRGILEVFSAGVNDIPVPIDGTKQRISNGVDVQWLGNGGIDGDIFTFDAAFQYGIANIFIPKPSIHWRSETDGSARYIVLDAGSGNVFNVDIVAFFNCNWMSGDFEMNATDSWGSPAATTSISFIKDYCTVSVADIPWIYDVAIGTNWSPGELKGCYARITSGSEVGNVYKIIDNRGDGVLLEGGEGANIAVDDSVIIYSPNSFTTFSARSAYRFARIVIDSQDTYEGYFKIGTVIAGIMTTLNRGWSFNYAENVGMNVAMNKTPYNALNPVITGSPKKTLNLRWNFSKVTRNQVLNVLVACQGRPVVIIPDDEDIDYLYLTYLTSGIKTTHVYDGGFRVNGLTFEEIEGDKDYN